MAVVNVNGISGINSITAQSNTLDFYNSAGNTLSIGASLTGNVTGNVTGNINSSGVSTLGNTVVGGGTTQLVVTGNARITGILTIGTSSITLDGSSNQVNVGTGVTLHHTDGVQVGGNNLHSTVLTVNQINASGVITATSFSGSGANLTGIAATTNVVTNSLVVSGITTVAAGSTAAPSITPTGDSNTGIFFPSADTIAFSEGGTEALRIDSSGRVTMPYQPMFSAATYSSSGNTVQTNIVAFLWTTISLNVGNSFNNTTGLFTAPVAGNYALSFNFNRRASANNWHGAYIVKNSTTIAQSWFSPSSTDGYAPVTINYIIGLSANDTIAFCYHNSFSLPSTSSDGNFASIFLVG